MHDDEPTKKPERNRNIAASGWRKPVAPPKAEARPVGLPPRPTPSPVVNNDAK
jgi:hypothetical protein